jgi:light-regulated signal transduction histidine kinase (bacteriophytochrome)
MGGFEMRSFFKIGMAVALGGFAVLGSSTPSASGNFFQDLLGVVTDPLKLKAASSELSESIERSLIQLNELESKTNYDVQQRLQQIHAIADEIIQKGDAAVADALNRMTALERKINNDAFALIARAECAAENVNARLQVALVDIMKQLIKADPRVEIAGFKAAEFIVNPVPIQNANEAYMDAKRKAFAALDKDHFKDQSDAAQIFWTYQNLKVMAKWTRCRYEESGALAFTEEMNRLERLSKPWVTVVKAKLI